jgi:hypothetical protein
MTLDLAAFAKKLQERLGIPSAKAEQYANAIGDAPEVDPEGLVVIRNEKGVVIDRISIPLD